MLGPTVYMCACVRVCVCVCVIQAGIHMHKAVSDPAMISLTDGEP